MGAEEINVRELKSKDLKMMLKLFSKLSLQSRVDLTILLKGASENENPDLANLGASVFQVLSELTDDLYAWLSDMSSINVDDLDEMPIATPIDIVKQILSKPEVKDFFGQAAQDNTS